MTLVDTSVWVDHLRNKNVGLAELLNDDQVLIHPFIIGELALGTLRNRVQVLDLLSKLPQAPLAEHAEVMATIDRHHLHGIGIGWIDAHLLASALLAKAPLLTLDKALRQASRVTGVQA